MSELRLISNFLIQSLKLISWASLAEAQGPPLASPPTPASAASALQDSPAGIGAAPTAEQETNGQRSPAAPAATESHGTQTDWHSGETTSKMEKQLCGWQGLGALAGCQVCASEVGEPSSGHWSTETSWSNVISNGESSPRDLHLNAKTQLHSTTSKLKCWTPYAKQLARQENKPTH